MFTVRRAFAKGRLKPYPKTERSRRRVPLRAKVLDALHGLPRRDGVLFPPSGGGRVDINNFRSREWASALAYRKLRARIDRSVGLLLSQGRGPGVTVLACLQDPRMEVLGFRNLFPTRVALQLDEAAQVDMVLGPGARDQGALCDKIPDSTRGVAYVRVEGVGEPTRVRAAYVTDDDIRTMAQLYAPGQSPGARLRAVLEGHGGPLFMPQSSRARRTRSCAPGARMVSGHDGHGAVGVCASLGPWPAVAAAAGRAADRA